MAALTRRLPLLCCFFALSACTMALGIEVSPKFAAEQVQQIPQQIGNLGVALMKLLNPFDLSREALQAAGDMVVVGMQSAESPFGGVGRSSTSLEEYPSTSRKEIYKKVEYNTRDYNHDSRDCGAAGCGTYNTRDYDSRDCGGEGCGTYNTRDYDSRDCGGEGCGIEVHDNTGCDHRDCEVSCDGTDCATEAYRHRDCTGTDCGTEAYGHTDCTGADCLAETYGHRDCTGTDCITEAHQNRDCSGVDCQNIYYPCDHEDCDAANNHQTDYPTAGRGTLDFEAKHYELQEEVQVEYGGDNVSILCPGNRKGYDCRGDDWDHESEHVFSNSMMDLQHLTEDSPGVIPVDVNWVATHVYTTAPVGWPTDGVAVGVGGINTNGNGVAGSFSSLANLAAPFAAGAAGGVAGGLTTALGIPAVLIAAKVAKPFAWKLALAVKVAFLKLLVLKKLLLVKAKVGTLKLAKGAFLAFPFLIVPLLKGLGLFKLISVALVGALKNLDCMNNQYGSCESQLSPEESLMLHLLPWFVHNREIINHDASDIFKVPNELIGTFINPSELIGTDIIRSLPHMAFTHDGLADIAQIFTGNVSNVASLFRPNFRRLQSTSFTGTSDAASQIQQVLQSVFGDLVGGFSAALQTYQEVRKEYNQFTELASQENPKLLERSLQEEMTYRLRVPSTALKVINTDSSLYDTDDAIAGQRVARGAPSISDIDSAFRVLAKSVQGTEESEDNE